MAKILLGMLACLAAFVLAESLTCNKCSFGLLGLCALSSTTETCETNTSVCATSKISFPSLSSFNGFSTLGCKEPAGCNVTANSTLLTVTIQTSLACCSTDRCNTVSGAPSNKMTFTAVIGVAVLASILGSLPM